MSLDALFFFLHPLQNGHWVALGMDESSSKGFSLHRYDNDTQTVP